MSAVRLDNNTRAKIRQKIWSKYEALILKEHEKILEMNLVRACYERHIPLKYRQNAEALLTHTPHVWLTTTDQQRVAIEFTYQNNLRRAHFVSKCIPPAPFPAWYERGTSCYEIVKEMPEYPALLERVLKIAEITCTRTEVNSELHGSVLNECTTIAQLVQIWPNAVNYLPEDKYKDFVNSSRVLKPKKTNAVISEKLLTELIKLDFTTT